MTPHEKAPAALGGTARAETGRQNNNPRGKRYNDLPQWARDIISSPPPAGSGFHGWIFRAAKALSRCGRGEYDIRAILETAAAGCGRRVPPRELEDAIKNGILSAEKRQPYVAARAWPGIDHAARNYVIRSRARLAHLVAESPVTPAGTHDAEWFIDALFPPGALICAAETNDTARTQHRDAWRGQLGALQYIVPSPMTATHGLNLQGAESARCLGNTGPRRFLVIESDTGTADEQAAILLHLAATAPLTLALHSGGKSIHGWFYAAGQPEPVLRRFMERAVRLGADYHTYTRCQLVRMPQGRNHKTGRRQRVLYYAPDTIL
jgi:hypothetical protein